MLAVVAVMALSAIARGEVVQAATAPAATSPGATGQVASEGAVQDDDQRDAITSVPVWVFPITPATTTTPVYDKVKRVHLPGSSVTYTEAQLADLFVAADWLPGGHSPMPTVVAHGRPPDVYACGYCHMPGGIGRPENAEVAGLPKAYIIQQVAEFRSGARRSAMSGVYRPTDLMIHVAKFATDDEVATAAAYFAKQKRVARTRVVETVKVPQAKIAGSIYTAVAGGRMEPLGERLMEYSTDLKAHEHRDPNLRYVAYVPKGSIARGKRLVQTGANGLTLPCSSCHGNGLQGAGLVPPLAGDSPSYVLRQLLGFQTGARAGTNSKLMSPVVAKLAIGDLIDVAAYVATLPP